MATVGILIFIFFVSSVLVCGLWTATSARRLNRYSTVELEWNAESHTELYL